MHDDLQPLGPISQGAFGFFFPTPPTISTNGEDGIGPVLAAPWGSASILPIFWSYFRMMGDEKLRKATPVALLKSIYLDKMAGRPLRGFSIRTRIGSVPTSLSLKQWTLRRDCMYVLVLSFFLIPIAKILNCMCSRTMDSIALSLIDSSRPKFHSQRNFPSRDWGPAKEYVVKHMYIDEPPPSSVFVYKKLCTWMTKLAVFERVFALGI